MSYPDILFFVNLASEIAKKEENRIKEITSKQKI